MNQKVFCEDCQTELSVIPPPFPPQMCNSPIMSSVVMVNGRAECPKCGVKYVSQIVQATINLGFRKIQDEPRIVVPNGPVPGLKV